MLRILKSRLFLLALLTLGLFVVIGIASKQDSRLNWLGNSVSTVFSPFQKLFSAAGRQVEKTLSYFGDFNAIKKENAALRDEIDRLKKENTEMQEYKEKNKELRDALNLKDQFSDYISVGANIIAKDMGNWSNIFLIDRGLRDGITGNSPVITGSGLVGTVLSAGQISSKVIAIIDLDSTVSARISRTRDDMLLVKGDLTLRKQGLCRMDIPLGADVSVGDILETSGLGGMFPKGIIIGRVKEIRQAAGELTPYAVVKPAVDFGRLEEVFILRNKSGNMTTDGEK